MRKKPDNFEMIANTFQTGDWCEQIEHFLLCATLSDKDDAREREAAIINFAGIQAELARLQEIERRLIIKK